MNGWEQVRHWCLRVVFGERFESGEDLPGCDLLAGLRDKPLVKKQRAARQRDPAGADVSLPERGLELLPMLVVGRLGLDEALMRLVRRKGSVNPWEGMVRARPVVAVG
jgi:hypothetical protein